MAIILCVEKNQPRNFTIDQFVDQLKQNIPDYFAKATFNNFTINRIDVLVDSTDAPNNTVYAFELPDYLAYDPSVNDTSYVCNPWMVRNVLARADRKYNFANYDYNNDGTVDMVDFVVIRHTALHNGGTVGLSTGSIYTTTDPFQGGGYIKIDGSYTRDSNGRLHAIIRKYRAEDFDSHVTHIVHELGHAFFDFPDYDHNGYTMSDSYVFGQFCVMNSGGFSTVASPFNPLLRVEKGWATSEQITNSQTVSFTNIESSPHKMYWYNSIHNNITIGNWAATYHEFVPNTNNRWIHNWPIPRSSSDNIKRGVMVWDLGISTPGSTEFGDIEAAHGLWDWTLTDVSTIAPPNDRRPVRSATPNPLSGLDSLDVRYSYEWLVYNQATGQYDISQSDYPDHRLGSETCFYDPLHSQNFSFYSNPNSCGNYGSTQSRCSGLSIENIRLDNGIVKADFRVGEDGYVVKENVTLPKGNWLFSRNLVINSGATLTIQPGSTIRFAPRTATTNAASLIVYGTLIANGTQNQRITFEFYNKSASDQNGIKFYYTGSADSITYADIKNANNAVYCYNSSPTLLNNSFYDSNTGLDCQYYSSPTLAGYYLNGNNIMTRNNRGINSYYYSNPFLGGSYGGYNSIYGNTTYNISASYGCSIYAMNNWWGNPIPDPNKIYQYQSTIDYTYPLSMDPNSGRPLSKTTFAGSTGNSGPEDELITSLYLQMQEKYDEAIASYRKFLSKELKTSKSAFALSKLSECYEKTGKKDFIDFLNKSIRAKSSKDDDISITALELENLWLMKQGRYTEAIKTLSKIKADYKEKKDTYKFALFNEGYINFVFLNDVAKAKESFTELEEKYPDDPLVAESKILMGVTPGGGYSAPKNIASDDVDNNKIPETYALLGNYPNPFNPTTTIRYAIPKQSLVEVKIYNIMGNEVRSYTINSQSAGYHNLLWDGKNMNNEQVSSGTYIYRLRAVSYEAGEVFEKSAKMLIIK